jgi:hypothetical protein
VPYEQPQFRNYRIELTACGPLTVWVTAESRQAAYSAAEGLWRDNWSVFGYGDTVGSIEILDEYEDGGAA